METFRACGSTSKDLSQLHKKLKDEKMLEVVGDFAGYGLEQEEKIAVIESYQELGIENTSIARGDILCDQEEFTPHSDRFAHASDLMAFIRPKFNFYLGVAAYPEGHIVAESREKDLEYLK